MFPDKSEKILSPESFIIKDIVREVGYNPESVIVVKNGCIVPEDLKAKDGGYFSSLSRNACHRSKHIDSILAPEYLKRILEAE